jgi:hypothetical protein
MTFESPVLKWLILGVLFVGLPVLLGLAVAISRLARVKSGCLPFLLFVASIFILVFGIATYLNRGGQQVSGEVLTKSELLAYHLDGSWNRLIEAEVKYQPSDNSPPVTDTLSLLPARFDDMHQGDFVQLRCFQVPGLFRFTRLEDQNARAQVWAKAVDRPFFFLLALGLLAVLGAGLVFHAKLPTLFFLTGFVTILAWWITGVLFPIWQETSLRLASFDTTLANVREVHHPYLGKGLRAWFSAKLFVPYDVIVMDMIPLGRSERLMSIDVVDRDSVNVRPGSNVTVRYSPADPRFAVVPDTGHSFIWKNGLLTTFFSLIALAAVMVVTMILRQQLGELAEEDEEAA